MNSKGKKSETFPFPRCAVPVSGSAESDGAAWIEFLLVSAVGCYQPGLHNVCFGNGTVAVENFVAVLVGNSS